MSNIYGMNKNDESESKAHLYPLFIIMAIIPLIVHQKEYTIGLSRYQWFSYQNTGNDFFLYYKSFWLVIIAVLMLVILCIKLYKHQSYRTIPKVLIPAGIYGLFVIISMIFSINPTFSIKGSMEQFESGFVLLGYLIFMYYSYLLIESEKDLKFLIKVWMISMGVLCILGLSQIIGHDFFTTDLGKKLITSRKIWDNLDQLSFSFGENRIYLTLYNPNYVGVYASIAIPILVTLLLFTKQIKMKVMYVLLTIGMVICIVGSESKTAFLTLAVVGIVGVLVFRAKLLQYWKRVLGGVIACIILFVGVDFALNHSFTNSIKSAIQSITNPQKSNVSKVETLDDGIVIYYLDEAVHISYVRNDEQYSFVVQDDEGNRISTENQDNVAVLKDERFQNIKLTPVSVADTYGIQVIIDDSIQWYFSNETADGDTTYYFYTPYGKWNKIANPEAVTMNEKMFSGRGYIWSRTIPELKNYILKGSGPDTYVLVFPQDDYIGLENNGFKGSVVTKPHNLYLQIWIQTGLISLIAFLALYIIYFVQSIRVYGKSKFETYSEQLGVGIFLSMIAYLISGITNDSTITVAPSVWILLGLGFGINRRLKISRE